MSAKFPRGGAGPFLARSLLAKTSFLEVKSQISEIHLQQQIRDLSKERLKNDY